MIEDDLKRVVCLHPELVEKGLVIEEEEYPIRGQDTTYRCDLRGRDINGKLVFIELKLNASHRCEFQIFKYRTLAGQEGRFLVACLNVAPDVPRVLKEHGYEFVQIDSAKARQLLEDSKSDPQLYWRKWPAQSVRKQRPIKTLGEREGYTDEEERLVMEVFKELAELIPAALSPSLGVKLLQPVPYLRSHGQKVWLLFSAPTATSTDRFAVYARSRDSVKEGLELHFVPCFSASGGGAKRVGTQASKRKADFCRYVSARKPSVEDALGRAFSDDLPEYGNTLRITSQGWKGLCLRIARPLPEWEKPDFPALVAQRFVSFVERTLPFIKEFDS